MMQSAIYKGILQHCRHYPKRHFFQYRVFMMYLDLTELDAVFAKARGWSFKTPALAWLRRKDFIGGDSKVSIADSVRAAIKQATNRDFTGSIRMLANLRYFGFQMNPIVCYYCFNGNEQLEYVVAEVTNTPWREKRAYVLRCDPKSVQQRIRFEKTLHVSPFNDMHFTYEWIGAKPGASLAIRLINWRGEQRVFEANLALDRQVISTKSLYGILLAYPFMTFKVFVGIYWQALRLFLKGLPLVNHPGTSINDKTAYSNNKNPDSTLSR